ncbi:MAG: hypothetical protein ACYDH5_03625 [Acidimicrobiales bacterium]
MPDASLYSAVVGQDAAVAALVAAAADPVHAYLIVGPPGTGKLELALGFAASLVCPSGGCNRCDHCRRALARHHPDVAVLDRSGPAWSVQQAREMARVAARAPMESHRQVIVMRDAHLALGAAPALLKTVEEPRRTTIFVLLADRLAASMATLTSRLAIVGVHALPAAVVEARLIIEGVPDEVASAAAMASSGSMGRARLLSGDPELVERRALWAGVPDRLDGTGATTVAIAEELIAATDGAMGAMRQRHVAEVGELTRRGKGYRDSEAAVARRQLEAEHKAAERRYRGEEMSSGLSALEASYQQRLVAGIAAGSRPVRKGRQGAQAIELVAECSSRLSRNASEKLQLEGLVWQLSRLASQ